VAKAWEVSGLGGSMRFRRAAGRVVLTRWREMMSYRDGTLLGEDIEELHAMRVSSRRLRAAMDAFAGAFPARSFRPYLRQVKEITDTLGAARDLDVAMEGLEALLRELDESERAGIEGLVARLRADRAAETPRIAALFARLEAEGFAERFEDYMRRRTGIDVRRLDPRPPVPAEG
jgi:CHAD domain-containing protein